jgi:chromosome segregation ATPase
MAEDYDILPHKLMQDLQTDVELLKKKLTEPETKMNELILEIETLKDSIHELTTVFDKALSDTKDEDVYATITQLNNRLDSVITQNETIAKGMIAISDKVEDFVSNSTGGKANQSVSVPNMSQVAPGQMVPPTEAPAPTMPPPPPTTKKRSLF